MASDPAKIMQHRQKERALALGRAGDPLALSELITLLKSPFAEVRRLSASAIGKLAAAKAVDGQAAAALLGPAIGDSHPQVQQYALKALAKYPKAACLMLDRLRDVARNGTLKSYVRTAAAETIATIEDWLRVREAAHRHFCTRCRRGVDAAEYMRAMDWYGRAYCTHCFDEVQMEGRNFEATVESSKQRATLDGTVVQSKGEKRIADWLTTQNIRFVYDERLRVARDTLIRPDFYLPEFDLYIEYWGLDTPEYLANKQKKLWLYQRTHRKLISLSYRDDAVLENILAAKMASHVPLAGKKNSGIAGSVDWGHEK